MDDVDTKPSLRGRAAGEFKEFCVVAVYFYICFTALAYLKFAILEAHGIAFAPFGFAAAKALICAKFVSLGHALHLGERFKRQPLIWPVLHKSLSFLALLVVLNILEELIVGWWHGRTLIGFAQRTRRRHARSDDSHSDCHAPDSDSILYTSRARRGRRRAHAGAPLLRAAPGRPPRRAVLNSG